VLTVTVNRQLSSLVSQVHVLLSRVQTGAATDEIELRVAGILQVLDELQASTGLGPTGSFNTLARHLHWLQRYHREGKPERYASDIADLQERDLPGVIASVEDWGQHLLDTGLVDAITASWTAQHFGSAVRDAFIYLEDVLRDVGHVEPSTGLSGDRLVTSVLAPAKSTTIVLPEGGFMGQLTRGEREGLYNFFKGAFLLFRNATAHRPIPYSASEAEDIIHVVNLCLRLLPPRSGGDRV
jgi:uncharacterized protein (TIGR02391 family)